MIQSTGKAIRLKDRQEENAVILNGRFTFNPSSEAYHTAEVLEIYLPDLSIPKSSLGFAYISSVYTSKYGTTYRPCTILKAWIKDRNTLCIEKLPIYYEYEEVTIWLYSLFTTLGRCGTPSAFKTTYIKYNVTSVYMRPEIVCVIQPEWCFLHLIADYIPIGLDKQPIVGELEKFPKDIDAEVPLVGGSLQSGDDAGINSCTAHIKGGILEVAEKAFGMSNTGQNPFICAYLIRDG